MAHSKLEYYQEIYDTRTDYKRDLTPMFDSINALLTKRPASVLDYGCGQGNLADLFKEHLQCRIAKYDPAIPAFSKLPEGHFELGVNTDVLEHIPEPEIDGLLSAMRSYVDHAFFNIHLAEAAEILSNGENAHCTIKPPEWWRAKIAKHFGQAYIVESPYPLSCSIITWKPSLSTIAGQKACATSKNLLGLGRRATAKAKRLVKKAILLPVQNLQEVQAYQTGILKEQLNRQDIQYRDILDITSGRKTIKHNDTLQLETDHPIAYESLDHLHPFGTLQDNTRNYAFYQKCHTLFGESMSYMDIGCSGGGLVFEFALNGHTAIGLEGSDLSQKYGRANWRTIPNNLFTCDVTKPFTVHAKGNKKSHQFDVISAWEVFEHIPENDLAPMLENIKKHLSANGIFVGSISKITDDPLHVTIKQNNEWVAIFQKNGFEMHVGYNDALEHKEFCRGIKSGMFDSHDYRTEPHKGLHFVARKIK